MPDPALDTMLKTALHDYVDELTPMRAPSFADVRRHARRRQLVRRGGGVASAAVVVGLGATLVVGTSGHDPVVEPGGNASSSPTVPTRGAVVDGPTVDCAKGFTVAGLEHQQFAFAGRVLKVGALRGVQRSIPVSFRVTEWYRGGSGKTVTVLMQRPYDYPAAGEVSYRAGTRLLLAGTVDNSNDGQRHLAFGCGFTRYFTTAVAAQWQTILRG